MKIGRILPLCIFGSLIIFFWRSLSLDPHKLPSIQVGKLLPTFALSNLEHDQLFSSQMLSGKSVLLNIWASWCDACIEEQDFLMHLAQTGITIYGINYKDNNKSARHWLKTWGNPYQLVGEDNTGKVAMNLGVYGTPETFLIDSNGIVRFRHAGILNAQVWEKDFIPRMR